MTSPLHHHAQGQPTAPAVVSSDRTWSYRALDAAVREAAGRLRNEGIASGDRVALVPSRQPKFIVLLWALWRVGAVAVPLSRRLPGPAQRAQAERVGGQGAVVEDPEPFTSLRPVLSVEDMVSGGSPRPERRPEQAPDRDATIVFTSGSTGRPKAALHTWANHLYSAKGANANLPLRRGDRWLLSLPLYHVGGLAILVRCALAGAAVAVPDPETDLATALVDLQATHVSCVATQLRRVLNTYPEPPAPLRAALLGGGPLPAPLLDRAYEGGWPVLTSYGCTEMASQVTTTAPGASRSTLNTAGTRLPHRRVRIGPDGQILVAGRTLFRGYVQEGTVTDPREDGWYPTGDRGRFDAQGRLHVVGRIDRMFVSGGENIQPEEIEGALGRISGVTQAVVVPVSNPEYGHRPVAFIRTDGAIDEGKLRERLRDRLPGFKIPDVFFPFPEGTGESGLKVDRQGLQEWAQAHVSQGTDPEGDTPKASSR